MINSNIFKTFTVVAITLISVQAFSAFTNTSQYWKCFNRIGGSWTFARAPWACSSSAFIGDDYVKTKFSPYIFDDAKNRTNETERYITEMNHLVIKTAEYYIKKRKPGVSQTEVKYWTQAIQAITHQESFISHYRDGSDNIMRMMRGDFGHGHGLMQVDDRHHFVNVNSGKAANLMGNLFYALDIYYDAWQAAPSKWCVSGNNDYYNRIRAAYGAYNGGPSSICRFKNPNHKWSRNDKNFKDKLDGKTWKRYVTSETPTLVDVACLANSTSTDCTSSSGNGNNDSNGNSQDSGNDGETDNGSVKPTPPPTTSTDVFMVGDDIKLLKNINARKTPGGRWLGTFSAGETYQVLDVYKANDAAKSRYYLIRKNRLRGYIYAGNSKNYKEWAIAGENAYKYLPVKDSLVRVATTSGTNLRATPGGKYLTKVPSGTVLRVIKTFIKDSDKQLYIKVNYRNTIGYLYSGLIAPRYTTPYWISILED